MKKKTENRHNYRLKVTGSEDIIHFDITQCTTAERAKEYAISVYQSHYGSNAKIYSVEVKLLPKDNPPFHMIY